MNIEQRVQWIKDKVTEYGAEGIIFNVGADVESAVLAHLANQAFPGKAIGVWAGTQTLGKRNFLRTMESSGMVYNWVNVEYGLGFSKLVRESFELANPYLNVETMEKYFHTHEAETDKSYKDHKDIDLITDNMKNRFKSSVAAAHAEKNNYLLASSLNKTRFEVGMFANGAEDAGVIAPLIDLTRAEIKEMAKELGVNQVVIDASAPSGVNEDDIVKGLYGFTYGDAEKFINGEEVDAKDKIQALQNSSKVKKQLASSLERIK